MPVRNGGACHACPGSATRCAKMLKPLSGSQASAARCVPLTRQAMEPMAHGRQATWRHTNCPSRLTEYHCPARFRRASVGDDISFGRLWRVDPVKAGEVVTQMTTCTRRDLPWRPLRTHLEDPRFCDPCASTAASNGKAAWCNGIPSVTGKAWGSTQPCRKLAHSAQPLWAQPTNADACHLDVRRGLSP